MNLNNAANKKSDVSAPSFTNTRIERDREKFSIFNCRVWGIEMQPHLLAPLHSGLLEYRGMERTFPGKPPSPSLPLL